MTSPHMTCNRTGRGEVVLEWWNGERKLTVYIESEGMHYVKSWGADINTDMQDGDLQPDALYPLIEWCFAAEAGP